MVFQPFFSILQLNNGCIPVAKNLSLLERNKSIIFLHEKGASAKQLNRLTGTPRRVIERIISKNKHV